MTFAEIKDRLAAIEVGLTTLHKRQEELVRYILLQVDKAESAKAEAAGIEGKALQRPADQVSMTDLALAIPVQP